MIRRLKIFVFLIFSLFLFHTTEQTLLLFEQSNQHALQYPSNNQGDLEQQLSSDIHSCAEDVIISTSLFSANGITKTITLSLVLDHRLLTPILCKHWEPPK